MPAPRFRLHPDSFAYLLLLGVLSGMAGIATDMSLPALGAIAESLGVTMSGTALTLSVFMCGFAIAPLACGPLGDHYGRRPVLLAGSALFALSALGCALAPSLGVLLVCRLFQGVGAGACFVMSLTIVRDVFQQGNTGRSRMSYMATLRLVTPMIAPTLGGWVLVLAGWREIYGTIAAVGALATVAVYFGFTESRPAHTVGVASFASLARSYLTVLRNRYCLGYSLINGLGFGSLFAYVTGVPLVAMEAMGLSAHGFSLMFALAACGIMTATIVNGRLSARGVSPHKLMRVGLLLAVASSLLLTVLSFAGYLPLWLLVILLILNNATFGIISPNASHAAVEPMPRMAGIAAGVVSSMMMGMGALGGALVTVLFDGHSARGMAGIMLACALGGAGLYFFWMRRLPNGHGAV